MLLDKLNYYQGKTTSASNYLKLAFDKFNQIDKNLIENVQTILINLTITDRQ